MVVTYSWSVDNLERCTENDSVSVIHYRVLADDGTLQESAYGSVDIFPGAEEAFIPYSELTPEIVVQWAKQKIGDQKVEKIEEELARRIQGRQVPLVTAGVPW